jgi:hypothetical protein
MDVFIHAFEFSLLAGMVNENKGDIWVHLPQAIKIK